jgi:hypothetical protein
MGAMSYENRPSKAVTRSIFVEMLRHLKVIAPLTDYQYVGFGALEFVDFDVVHRRLGIEKMTSIEASSPLERYEYNRPFSKINVLSGRAQTVLPGLDWRGLSIVWLDYTSSLTHEVIRDVEHMARVLIPGSVLAVTVNAHPDMDIAKRRTNLEKAIGSANVPVGVSDNKLGQWGLAEVQQGVLHDHIDQVMSLRLDSASWRQILNVQYQDSARMQMIAGIVSAPVADRVIDDCRFHEMPEYRSGKDALNVFVPLLTKRERAWFERRMPLAPGDPLPSRPGIKASDVEAFVSVYRWVSAPS